MNGVEIWCFKKTKTKLLNWTSNKRSFNLNWLIVLKHLKVLYLSKVITLLKMRSIVFCFYVCLFLSHPIIQYPVYWMDGWMGKPEMNLAEILRSEAENCQTGALRNHQYVGTKASMWSSSRRPLALLLGPPGDPSDRTLRTSCGSSDAGRSAGAICLKDGRQPLQRDGRRSGQTSAVTYFTRPRAH